jgi:hypothetical protein
MYHLLYQSVTFHFVFMGVFMILSVNSVNYLIFVMVKCSVLFEVRPELLKSYTSFGFTFTLFLPEGRAGVAWEPSNKMMLFIPPNFVAQDLSPHSQ